MNDGMNKFRELLLTDEAFQKKMFRYWIRKRNQRMYGARDS